jgi:hypothetical protein
MSLSLPIVPDTHPFARGLRLAGSELEAGRIAMDEGNDGRARVCARRAVGAFLQEAGRATGVDYGAHALANLRSIADHPSPPTPDAVRDAARRLLGGARSILAGEVYSSAPIADAIMIIRHVLETNDR